MSTSSVTIAPPRRTSARVLDHLTGRVLAATALPALLLPVLLAVAVLDRSRSNLVSVATSSKGGRFRDDTGSVVEWVLVVAIVVGITVTVGLLIRTKITDKSNELDLTTP